VGEAGNKSDTIWELYYGHSLTKIVICPGLDQIFIWLGPMLPTPPSLPALAWELFLVGTQL
jgi:hypothetical protein